MNYDFFFPGVKPNAVRNGRAGTLASDRPMLEKSVCTLVAARDSHFTGHTNINNANYRGERGVLQVVDADQVKR